MRPPQNVETGVGDVVKVAVIINLILESLERNSEQRIDLSGSVVSIRRTCPGNSSSIWSFNSLPSLICPVDGRMMSVNDTDCPAGPILVQLVVGAVHGTATLLLESHSAQVCALHLPH